MSEPVLAERTLRPTSDGGAPPLPADLDGRHPITSRHIADIAARQPRTF